jgi:Gpi18-like mannosyltransferase
MNKFAGLFRDLQKSVTLKLSKANITDLALIAIGGILAILIRWLLLDFKSVDFYASLKPWYVTIRSMGFSAFGTDFSTYNPPYLYELYVIARLFPDISNVLAVKLPSSIADFFCAYFVYRIVRLKYTGRSLALLAAIAVLFAPSIILNSAFWGQADALFTAPLLAAIYFLMTRKNAFAFIAFGLSLAFKLQAIFMAPLLIALLLRKSISWKYFLIVPGILLLTLVPAWAAGRSVSDLVNIYPYQTSQFEYLTMNAASVYAWLPGTKQVFNLFYLPGVIMGAAAAFTLCVLIYKGPSQLTLPLMLEFALITTLVVPFFLPKMHERYFYPADVLSIAFAFYFPQLFYIPMLVGGVSFLSYELFFFGTQPVLLPLLAFVMLIAISILVQHATCQFYAPAETEKSKSDLSQSDDTSLPEPSISAGQSE